MAASQDAIRNPISDSLDRSFRDDMEASKADEDNIRAQYDFPSLDAHGNNTG